MSSGSARLAAQLRSIGLRRSVALALRHRRGRRLDVYPLCASLLTGRSCLEIGGPSALFRRDGPLPVYPLTARVDNCTFARATVWEGAVEEGQTFAYDDESPPGRQYIVEATDLAEIADGSYDAVLASHVLEHVANPLRALAEWSRVVGEDGTIVLVVPHREATFDHRRPTTALEHLVDDFERQVGEDDRTHVAEFVELFDLARDPVIRTREQLAARTAAFAENRCIHHHVFDSLLVARLLDRAGLELLALEPALPFHVVAIARRPSAGRHVSNEAFLRADAPWRTSSPFAADRAPSARSPGRRGRGVRRSR